MKINALAGALACLKVLDLSRVLAGPWCTVAPMFPRNAQSSLIAIGLTMLSQKAT